MTIVEIAAILVAVAFAVLVGFLVPVMIQVRKTVAESEQLLAKMNNDLPPLIGELRAMSQNMNDLTEASPQRESNMLPSSCTRSGKWGSRFSNAQCREGLERIDVDQCGERGCGI